MKHFQSKVLTAAILAALSGSAIAAENVYTTKDVDTKIDAAKTEVTTNLKSEITRRKRRTEQKAGGTKNQQQRRD